MLKEKNYDFKFRMRQIHTPGLRNPELIPAAGEYAIQDNWVIAADAADGMLRRTAADLQDYFQVSMALSLRIVPAPSAGVPALRLELDAALTGGYQLDFSADGIVVRASEARMVWFGALFLEELFNLRGALFFHAGVQTRRPLTRMRSVHSGCGIDEYPDWQLNAIAHAGFTAIDVFVKDIDRNNIGFCDINDIIRRAREFGLDTMLYNYMPSYIHPDAPGATELFDSVYGRLFRHYPEAKGLVLCGESLEFPSQDPATTGKRHSESVIDGIPDTRPSPGWWPCTDYPDYLNAIERAVRKVKPDAEVVINTYNWGYVDLALRRRLLEKLSKTITVQTTFEIFKAKHLGNLSCPIMDYTISAAQPGEYFTSELTAAAELGFKTRCTTNTAGASWDFGTVPYVPVPFRWLARMNELEKARCQWGLDSYYENHHYGWWPNPAVDLAKFAYWSPRETDFEGLITQIAARDYGANAAAPVVRAWRIWSDAMEHYVASNEDQYGPWRVGPAYPFIFHPNITRTMSSKEIKFPTAPHAHFGYRIIKTMYQPYENVLQSPGRFRYPAELKELAIMLEMWNRGLEEVAAALALQPESRRDNGRRLEALGRFIRNSIRTTINIKNWYLLNIRLLNSDDVPQTLALLDELEALAQLEAANTRDTIPAVETDSRLGWEPSMEYVADRRHLEWKLRQLESARGEIAAYRQMVTVR